MLSSQNARTAMLYARHPRSEAIRETLISAATLTALLLRILGNA